MAQRDPLLPNAGIVARREYRDRTRSGLYIASTIILAVLAMFVALAPIAIRYLDRQTVTRIVVVAPDTDLAVRAASVADTLLNIPPPGTDAATWKKPFSVEVGTDAAECRGSAGDRAWAASWSCSGCLAARSMSRCGPPKGRTAPEARS